MNEIERIDVMEWENYPNFPVKMKSFYFTSKDEYKRKYPEGWTKHPEILSIKFSRYFL